MGGNIHLGTPTSAWHVVLDGRYGAGLPKPETMYLCIPGARCFTLATPKTTSMCIERSYSEATLGMRFMGCQVTVDVCSVMIWHDRCDRDGLPNWPMHRLFGSFDSKAEGSKYGPLT
jgi:hypothetical protein